MIVCISVFRTSLYGEQIMDALLCGHGLSAKEAALVQDLAKGDAEEEPEDGSSTAQSPSREQAEQQIPPVFVQRDSEQVLIQLLLKAPQMVTILWEHLGTWRCTSWHHTVAAIALTVGCPKGLYKQLGCIYKSTSI